MPKFNYDATGIGSLPFKDPKTACRIIFDNFQSIPFWPQLPRTSYKEHMYCQFSEGMPGIIIDENKKTIYIDSKKAADGMESVYQKYLDKDIDYFAISKDYAAGLYRFLDLFKSNVKGASFIKGHVTGPISFALSVTDENKKALIYDKDFFDVITKVLSMKAKWQIRKLKQLNPNVIIFIDEPYLVSIGSSFVNIQPGDVVRALEEMIVSIKEEGALAGIHCCGNTDWSMLLKRGIDILNFDAYNFIKEFFLYTDDIKSFLNKGGSIAWGMVPSSEAIDNEKGPGLIKKLKDAVDILTGKGIDKNMISSLITPSCGLGTLDEARAKKILELTNSISREIK